MTSRRAIVLVAAACVLVLPQIPVLGQLAYPLRLLTTSLHEIGHALAALLTGGQVLRIEIQPDASGVTWSAGGWRLAVTSAGYVGSTIFGCVLLVLAQRGERHRALLTGLLLFFGFFTLMYARNWLALLVGAVLLVLLVIALRSDAAGSPFMYFALDLVALSSCAYALQDFVNLLRVSWGTAVASGVTDAQAMAELTHIPATVWALGWGLFSLSVAWMSLRSVLAADVPEPAADPLDVP